MNISNNDPIIAISTPLKRSAIGIIRVSGKNILYILRKIFIKNILNKIKPRYAFFTYFKIKNKIIDNGILIYFKKPESYTGEDILELHCHGNPIILNKILNYCIYIGRNNNLRIALPGEFTKRSFLNKKIDINQAKNIVNLINTKNKNIIYSSVKIIKGSFSNFFNNILIIIENIRIYVESNIDFIELDVNNNLYKKIKFKLIIIYYQISKLLKIVILNKNYNYKFKIIIIGRPNVGKSSIFNSLLNSNISIVSNIKGTTRNKIKEVLFIDNKCIEIIDTAGIYKIKIKNNKNKIEFLGIKISWIEIFKAKLILFVSDIRNILTNEEYILMKKLPYNINIIFIINKIDIYNIPYNLFNKNNFIKYIFISVKKKIGIIELKKLLINFIKKNKNNNKNKSEFKYFFEKIIIDNIKKINYHIKKSIKFIKNDLILFDFLSEELRIIEKIILNILGKQFINEKILDKIFSKLCIGK